MYVIFSMCQVSFSVTLSNHATLKNAMVAYLRPTSIYPIKTAPLSTDHEMWREVTRDSGPLLQMHFIRLRVQQAYILHSL
jgi:hypothetical protein